MKYPQKTIAILICAIFSQWAHAESANSNENYRESQQPKTFHIGAGTLTQTLNRFAQQTGAVLVFEPGLTEGKTSTGLSGNFTTQTGFSELLKGTGLQMIVNDNGGYTLKKLPIPTPVKESPPKEEKPAEKVNSPVEVELTKVKVRAKRFKDIGPMPGLALTKEQIAGNIQSISAKEIKEAHSLSLADLLNSKLQSVNVNDYQGNPFQMDVTYRGFTASPQIGSPQGLSVFFDGIRVNEPFGDVVNWDLLPMNALSGFDLIPGSNPLFGLNTLGGALTMKTKSGFTSPGISAEVLAGSFGRKQLQASGGWNNANKEDGSWDGGNYAAFAAVNLFMEDGWRDNSPSKVNQGFAKLEWQGERTSLAFSTLGVVNKLVGNGTVPQELYRENPSAVFTSPDITRNKLLQFQISGAFDMNDKVNITGQVYHRQSNRFSKTGDIIPQEDFENGDDEYKDRATYKPKPGEEATCNLLDSNAKGYPDYYALDEATYQNFINTESAIDYSRLQDGTYDTSLINGGFNAALPPEIDAAMKRTFAEPLSPSLFFGIDSPNFIGDTTSFSLGPTGISGSATFFEDNGNKTYIFAAPATNAIKCNELKARFDNSYQLLRDDPFKFRNGFALNDSGVIEGTPTAVITKSDIQQTTLGGALQVNFNLDQHKAMLGLSIDQAKASYDGSQRYGLLDNNRNVYSAPDEIAETFYAADHDVQINKFKGTSTTKSIYASETWSPTQTLNFSASARYNYTDINNKLAPKIADKGLWRLRNRYATYQTCTPQGCKYNPSAAIDSLEFERVRNSNDPIRSGGLLDKSAIEKFTYHNFNPAFGATWQTRPNLNVYANWNQGTRVPSVIELGCAYDGTLVNAYADTPTTPPYFLPRSILENRGCSLPSALSGDPYLPQVRAQTIEAGARGKFGEFMEWNISAYRTNVSDDIYMTSLTPELNFFQSIGDTRRQGLEFGLAGEYGKSDFRINYSLTEATFESTFKTISPNNSSRTLDPGSPDFNFITVKPGNVLPGVPFNNFNFNWGYKFNPKFKLNLGLVAHSGSFLRGNENNAHTPSQGRLITVTGSASTVKLPDNQYDGTAPGYAVLNLSGRYDMGNGWALSTRINNLLDKTYYTAGRLGINPIAPSTVGAIGPGGFNYNSNEWIPSQFISAGAPRGVWVSLAYDFDPSKKALPHAKLPTEPNLVDLELPSPAPTAEELALNKQLDTIKALPVIKRTQLTTQQATQEVTNSVEAWHKALASKQADAYLALYATNFSPAGISHAEWAEKVKLEFATDAAASSEVNNVVVMPEAKRMVAVFNQNINRGKQVESMRKVLTFELKEGQWQITSEHTMPANPKVAAPDATYNNAPPTKAPTSKKQASKASNKQFIANVEVK